MSKRIIGINLSHDSSACLLEDGCVRAALALERTTGVKRGVVANHEYTAAMTRLITDILDTSGLTSDQVDHWIVTSTESRDPDDEQGLADTLGLIAPARKRLFMPHPGHHLAHASAAFYSSGYLEAAALVIDAYGSLTSGGRERESAFAFRSNQGPTLLWRHQRTGTRIAGTLRNGNVWVPDDLSGIGEIYRVLTLALGFNETGTTYDDAGKTMGLAAYGTPLSEGNLFIDISAGGLTFDSAAQSLVDLGMATRVEDGLVLQPRRRGEPLEPFHHNIAAQVQREFEDACLYLVRKALADAGTTRLALSGGCFLNSVLNSRIRTETDADDVFVFPAATDDGNAVGAALYAHHVLLNQTSVPTAMTHAYLGPTRALEDIAETADKWGLQARSVVDDAAAAAINAGQIIGLFQPRSEFGPRALGSRSLLCHPGLVGMKDRLNARVKFRESFRPFAAAVLGEEAPTWFDIDEPSPFMLRVCTVNPSLRHLISEVVHVDGTCRIQTVDETLPGLFRSVLQDFSRISGIPLVLNTSFNVRGQPIVEYPEQAIDALFGSRIDRLFIGEVEIAAPDWAQLRPQRLHSLPTDHIGSLPGMLLAQADGSRTVSEIAAISDRDVDAAVDDFLMLRRQGHVQWCGVPTIRSARLPLSQYQPMDSGRS